MPKPPPAGATVFISNISEDVWPFIQLIDDDKKRAFEIDENAYLSDRDLYSVSKIPDAYFITPYPIDPDFFNYQTKLTQAKNITVLVPQHHSGELSLDCITDKKLFKQLVELGHSNSHLTLLSYSASQQFYTLIASLKKHGVTVHTPYAPAFENSWTVNFLGSKTGFRQIIQKYRHLNPNLIMADGMICDGYEQIAQVATYKYLAENSVVIKTNKGHSGAGVLIYAPDELPHQYQECHDQIMATLKKDSYWDLFPVVIESYVKPDFSLGGGFPNVECRVRESGSVEILYDCGMRMSDQGVFQGVEIQEKVLPKKVHTVFTQLGQFIGRIYSKLGYRGYFDIDFIAGTDHKLYITESNVRQTGGTYAYEATRRLMGLHFMDECYSASNSGFPLQTKRQVTFKELKTLLEPVLFNKKTKEGIVLTTANKLRQHQVGYIVFGKNKNRANRIEEEMKELLKEL